MESRSEVETTVRRLVLGRVSRREIAEQVGLSVAEVQAIVHRLWSKGTPTPSTADPTPQEIAERAAEIRERWSEWDYRVRSVQLPEPCEMPVVTWRLDRWETI
jgi:transposase